MHPCVIVLPYTECSAYPYRALFYSAIIRERIEMTVKNDVKSATGTDVKATTGTAETNNESASNNNVNDSDSTSSDSNVSTDNSSNDSIMQILSSIKDEQASLRAQLISMKDSISQFVDAGGVIREDDNVPSIDDDESNDYVPIEELDLNI